MTEELWPCCSLSSFIERHSHVVRGKPALLLNGQAPPVPELKKSAPPPMNPPDDSKSGNTWGEIMMNLGEKRTSWDLLWWT